MRVIVACSECQRRYDASGKKPGDRFRCHCGAEVPVRRPRGHDAAVIRCSSCGAPREGRATACAHCGADFTVHDRDLETVCPNCLARVSDRAQFCHHCATALMAEAIAGDTTTLACPVCGPKRPLTSRRLSDEQINVLECQKCGGFWIGLETFQILLEHEAHHPQSSAPRETPLRDPDSRSGYRPCAVCGQLMVRRNFGRGSGVLVDICGSHGIWFDAQELSQVVHWIRSGGLEAARQDLARLRQSSDKVRKRQAFQRERPTQPRPARGAWVPQSDPAEDPWAEFIDDAVLFLVRLFRLR
jgi:Zn-finger nucleic acid-binding protein